MSAPFTLFSRHASIDPAVRAARGLPEDLIRLCVGIEDADDLLEDLERALLEAGALTLVRTADGEDTYMRTGYGYTLGPRSESFLTEKLRGLGLVNDAKNSQDSQWFVSAPGKVILFGEHAVVHGVVRRRKHCQLAPDTEISSLVNTDRYRCSGRSSVLWPYRCEERS